MLDFLKLFGSVLAMYVNMLFKLPIYGQVTVGNFLLAALVVSGTVGLFFGLATGGKKD